MAKSKQGKILKGFRDFLPEEMRLRNFVLQTMVEVFEQFSYQPIQTPTLEYQSVLLGKYGREADKLVYTFRDRGGREVGLKYDLTVPTARLLATNRQKLVLPFKRYQIQPVFRADKPQRGRYREFIQCDIDIFGVSSPLADAEILAVTYQTLSRLNLDKFVIKVNSRATLFSLLDKLSLPKEVHLPALQSLDKLTKLGRDGVKGELIQKGISPQKAEALLRAQAGISPDKKLRQTIALARQFGVPEGYLQFDASLVRGLDYYTGIIFETTVADSNLGSITGGGRYDNLIGDLGGPPTPAVGVAFGFDRICELIRERGLFSDQQNRRSVLVATFSDTVSYALRVVDIFRKAGWRAQPYLNPRESLRGQLAYGAKLGVVWVAIAGKREAERGVVTLKNMKTGEQKEAELTKSLPSTLVGKGE